MNKLELMLDNFIEDNAGNSHNLENPGQSLTLGFVVSVDDPLQQGRVQAFCPALNDDPKKLLHLPWCAYMSPFGGVISQNAYTRGHLNDYATSNGPVHYGFWAVPEIGAHVVVGCVNGDPRRRFWMGCMPSHQEVHTLGHGRYKWGEDAKPDGPLTSTGNPIEPLYSNFTEAFKDRASSEWKTRGADYQLSAILDPPTPDKSVYVDDDYETISAQENDEWVKGILGEHGYDWTGYKNLGAFLASRVYGITSPGFHSVTLDDRPFNSRVRIRTSAGHQILLDDTNERIYVSTYEGKSYVEMDRAGNIDVYAGRRLSINADEDINFSSGGTIRFKAKRGIYGYAGDTRGQPPLSETPADGQIRFHSTNDFHILSETNIRVNATNDFLLSADNLEISLNNNFNLDSTLVNLKASEAINMEAPDVNFKVDGKDATIVELLAYLDEFNGAYNITASIVSSNHGGAPTQSLYSGASIGSIPDPADDGTEIAPWTNRVPEHEPWPRVLLQDSGDTVNAENTGYLDNVDWIDQFDNTTSPEGREPIGVVEGDFVINRSQFWRR